MVQTWFAIFSQSFISLIWFYTTVMIYPLVCAGCVLFVFLIHLHKAADSCWALSTATSGHCELPVAFSSVTTPGTASFWRERQCENTRALVRPGLCSHLGPASSNSSRGRREGLPKYVLSSFNSVHYSWLHLHHWSDVGWESRIQPFSKSFSEGGLKRWWTPKGHAAGDPDFYSSKVCCTWPWNVKCFHKSTGGHKYQQISFT